MFSQFWMVDPKYCQISPRFYVCMGWWRIWQLFFTRFGGLLCLIVQIFLILLFEFTFSWRFCYFALLIYLGVYMLYPTTFYICLFQVRDLQYQWLSLVHVKYLFRKLFYIYIIQIDLLMSLMLIKTIILDSFEGYVGYT